VIVIGVDKDIFPNASWKERNIVRGKERIEGLREMNG